MLEDTFNVGETLESYQRRKEDRLLLDIQTLQQEVTSLNYKYETANKSLIKLLEAHQAEREERQIAQALEAEERKRTLAHNQLVSKVGSITLAILSMLLGSFLSYLIPAYMSKH